MFAYAMRQRIIQTNPCDLVDMKNIRPYCNDDCKTASERILSDAEYRALLDRLHTRQTEYPLYMADYAIELCMYTGLRVGEVVVLRWDCIKNGELHTLLKRIQLVQQENGITSEYIFADTNGRIIAPTISKAMYRRGSKAGIKAKSIHAIRRTVSSNLRKILPRATVALIMGHTEEVNENHYNYDILTYNEKKQAMNNFIAYSA